MSSGSMIVINYFRGEHEVNDSSEKSCVKCSEQHYFEVFVNICHITNI